MWGQHLTRCCPLPEASAALPSSSRLRVVSSPLSSPKPAIPCSSRLHVRVRLEAVVHRRGSNFCCDSGRGSSCWEPAGYIVAWRGAGRYTDFTDRPALSRPAPHGTAFFASSSAFAFGPQSCFAFLCSRFFVCWYDCFTRVKRA